MYGNDTRTATAANNNTVTCDNNQVVSKNWILININWAGLQLMIGGGTQNNSFSVRQVYNGKNYTIETNAATSLNGKIILYY